jgi:uncharacterized protein (DUF305 family)
MRNLTIAAIVLIAVPPLALAAGQSDAFKDAMNSVNMKMMTAMKGVPVSGDPDRDFAAMMMPHHQGAVDMAKLELQYGKDEQLRAMAQTIVASQEKEIAEMKAWLGAHP